MRMTKAQKIRKILDEGHIDPRHVLSLEVCIDRLNEGLPLTSKGTILCGYYSEELVAIRNRKVWVARHKKAADAAFVDGRGRGKKSPETRAKIAAAQRERYARLRAEKARD